MIPYPHIDPVAFSIWKFSVRWYGIAYVLGFILGLLEFQYLRKFISFSLKSSDIDKLLFTLIFSVLLGGRIGYILFYNLSYYLQHPMNMLLVNEGGMSFHGAVLGCIIGLWVYHYFTKKPFLSILDMIATVAPIGLFFGRLANFVNGELWGRPTSMPWGMIFPYAGNVVRHPSQLYEAILEGVVLWIVLFFSFKVLKNTPGKQGVLFIILYGVFRTFTGFFRAPDVQIGYIFYISQVGITLGQIFSCIMIAVGVIAWIFLKRTPSS